MKKEMLMIVFVSVLLVSSMFVYAAGSSSGGSSSSSSDTDTNIENDASVTNSDDDSSTDVVSTRSSFATKRTQLREKYEDYDCEQYDIRLERIKCRLAHGKDYIAPQGTVPEACKLTANTGRCVSFYSVVRTCYKLEGEAKDKCFKRAAGFRKAQLSEELSEERPQKARDYIVALLYDLQEKIEYHVEDGNIDPEVAAEMIDLIVGIKRDIMNGEGKSVVKPKLMDLRKMWNDSILEEEDE
jgi:hypothetical protein